MEIGTRLSSALTTINIRNKDLVDIFKISQQYASSIKKADKINDTIAKIANHYDININWLMSGQGDMFVQNDSQTNNLQNSNIAGSGVNNGSTTINSETMHTLNCDQFTKSLFEQLCTVYKDDQKKLQEVLFKVIQNAESS